MRKEIAELVSIISADSETVEAEFAAPRDFAGFQGHFSAGPILPGVCMIDAVLRAAEAAAGARLSIGEVRSAKFFAPVLPEMPVKMKVTVERNAAGCVLRAELNSQGRKTAKIAILANRT